MKNLSSFAARAARKSSGLSIKITKNFNRNIFNAKMRTVASPKLKYIPMNINLGNISKYQVLKSLFILYMPVCTKLDKLILQDIEEINHMIESRILIEKYNDLIKIYSDLSLSSPSPEFGISISSKLTLEELEDLVSKSEADINKLDSDILHVSRFIEALKSKLSEIEVAITYFWNEFWQIRFKILNFTVSLGEGVFWGETPFKTGSLVVYSKYKRIIYILRHVFERTIFVFGKKLRFNKLWLKDKDLPKFVEKAPETIVVPGFTTEKRIVVFADGNTQERSRVIYHKYDFDSELERIENSLNTITSEYYRTLCEAIYVNSVLLQINAYQIINVITRDLKGIEGKVQIIENEIETIRSRKTSLVVYDNFNYLPTHDYILPMFKFDDVLYTNAKGLTTIYERLVTIKETLMSINIARGFVESCDIFNNTYYPYVGDIISYFISKKDYSKLNNYFKTSVYKWIINIIILSFNVVAQKCLSISLSVNKKNISLNDEMILNELICRFRVLTYWSYNMLDNSIKQHLIKRNLTINSDIIAGFDTEYVPFDWGKNELLTAQVSSTHVLKLSVPLRESYIFEGVNTLSSETYMKATPKFSNVSNVLNIINKNIEMIRTMKYGNHDMIMRKIASWFNNQDFVKNVVKGNKSILFGLDKSAIQNTFILPAKDESLELSFETLINIIKSRHNRSIEEEKLLNIIKFIDYANIDSDFNPDLRFDTIWTKETMNNTDIKSVVLDNNLNANAFFDDVLIQTELDVLGLKAKGKDILKILREKEEKSSFTKTFLLDNFQKVQQVQNSLILSEGYNPDEGANAPLPLLKGELGGWITPGTSSGGSVGTGTGGPETKILINFKRSLYLSAHYNAADLQMLQDWKSVSFRNVDIVKKCFTSLSLPMNYIGKEKVYLRDSFLLSSAAASSLKAVAYAYKLEKIEIPQHYISRMDILFKDNFDLFKSYAMNDSLIGLMHTLFINDFAFRLGNLRIPNTLGTLSSKYIKNKWKDDGYRGYQIDVNYPLGDARSSHTPKGIQFGNSTLELSNLFIGSYRGGRNECFVYGKDTQTKWYDYDLTSCYSTIMSMMGQPNYEENDSEALASFSSNVLPFAGQPDYSKGCWINPKNMKDLNFKESYSALRVQFAFPDTVKYPPFPVILDNSITVYPLSGETLITGLEYMVGLRLLNLHKTSNNKKDFFIKVLHGAYIPFKKDLIVNPNTNVKEEVLAYSPFFEVIDELQAKRRAAKKSTGKGSAMERIYKDLGNMLYGKIVCGISNKQAYDARNDTMKTMIGNDLSNPIIGTWITGFVRSLICELLNSVDKLGGRIISCTTDGFVTDIEHLEQKICQSDINGSLLKDYRDIREKLSGDSSALEVKTSVRGIIQWTTRGQMSIDSSETGVPISAATGYQKTSVHKENLQVIENAMINGNKILFLSKQLTGALESYKRNLDVSMKTSQKTFRTIFDSKRFVIKDNKEMLDTRPFKDVTEALLHRYLMNTLKSSVYSDEYSLFTVTPSTNSRQEVVKLFIRMASIVFNYNIPVIVKHTLAEIIKEADKSFNITYILSIMAAYESDKGNVVSKIPILKNSALFVEKLYILIEKLASQNEIYLNILEAFKVSFDNFDIPRSKVVLKEQLLTKLKGIEADRLNITINDNEISIKIK